MKAILCITFAFVILHAPSSEASLQVCPSVLSGILQNLQRLQFFNNQRVLDNLIQSLVFANQEASKQEPLTNNAQAAAIAQYISALAAASSANRTEFQNRSQISRMALISAYNTAWLQFRSIVLQIAGNRSPTDQSFAAIVTQLQNNCDALQSALDDALLSSRTDNSNLVNDAAAPLTDTRRFLADCFRPVQLFLAARRYDIALLQAYPVLANALLVASTRQRSALMYTAASVRFQVTISSSATISTDLRDVDTALKSFTPTGSVNDLQSQLATTTSAAQMEVSNLATLPSGVNEAILRIATDFCTSVETSVQQIQSENNLNFSAAIRAIIEVIGRATPAPAPAPAGP